MVHLGMWPSLKEVCLSCHGFKLSAEKCSLEDIWNIGSKTMGYLKQHEQEWKKEFW